MTEEELNEFTSSIQLALAHIDILTEELHEHTDYVFTRFKALVDAINS
jgi:hypothetical protein